jgi:predicted small lipoprotein YifL
MRFVALMMFALVGCGWIANPYELPPGIAAVAACGRTGPQGLRRRQAIRLR